MESLTVKERLSKVETNLKILANLEDKVGKIYKKIYENGMSDEIHMNTNFRKSVSKFFWIMLAALTGQSIIFLFFLLQKSTN